METKKVKLKDLKQNPNNPRVIKDDKFKKLVKSIQEFPEMLNIRPIVVNSDMVVLGGNMRLRAMQEAGFKDAVIIIAENLTEDQQKEFIIKDNVGFGEWNWDELANEWDAEKLDEWGLDLPLFVDEKEYDTTLGADSINKSEYELVIKIVSDKDVTLCKIKDLEANGCIEILKK